MKLVNLYLKLKKISTFGFLDELGVSSYIKNKEQKNKNIQNILKNFETIHFTELCQNLLIKLKQKF